MTTEQFTQSLAQPSPPTGCSVYLQSLWFDAKNDWEKAHELIQDIPGDDAAWIHAYLHRKEGDIGNADYWYRRAGRSRPSVGTSNEWEQLVTYFLKP